MKKQFMKLSLMIAFSLLAIGLLRAQCDVNAFTLTPTNGVCVQDGKVKVQIPGASTCIGQSLVIATIYPVGSEDALAYVSLSTLGEGDFNNLPPGDYEVLCQQGQINTARKPVSITSTYNKMVITATGFNTTCSYADPLYTNNGKITSSFTGGIGPFKVELLLNGSALQTINNTTNHSFNFQNLAPGNYDVKITDLSSTCLSSETYSVTVEQTVIANLGNPWYYFSRPNLTNCNKIDLDVGFQSYAQSGNPQLQLNYASCYIKVNNQIRYATGATINVIQFWGILNPGDVIQELYITDGCDVFTATNLTISAAPNNLLTVVQKKIKNSDCTNGVKFEIHAHQGQNGITTYGFQTVNTLTIYKEVPVMSNNWQQVSVNQNVVYLSNNGGFLPKSFPDSQTRYKIVGTDACHTVSKIFDPRTLNYTNVLNNVTVSETTGVYEGTSSILLSNSGNPYPQSEASSVSYPVTVEVTRSDNAPSVTINPTQPMDLAGSYTINFPVVAQFDNSYNNNGAFWYGPTIGDLPPGSYKVKITDNCGAEFNRTVTLSNPVSYAADNKVIIGCAQSDISFDMNPSKALNRGYSELVADNNGVPGTVIRDRFENAGNTLTGIFTQVPQGDYFVRISDVRYSSIHFDRGLLNDPSFSAIQNAKVNGFTYKQPFTVDPYVPVAFSTFNVLCDPNDLNSAILYIQATGTPVNSIDYSVWQSTSDPDVDTPYVNYDTSDVTEKEHIFTNLPVGDYMVRVIHGCGYTQQEVQIVSGGNQFPAPIVTPSDVICELDPQINLSIALPNSLFNINWYDTNNTLLGTNNRITLPLNQSENFSVTYKLKDNIGCTNSTLFDDSIYVTFLSKFVDSSGGTPLPSNTGISSLNRTVVRNNTDWPNSIKSSNLVLESKTLGFVMNRIARTAELYNISDPVEGMMVFDEEADCLKIYSTKNNGVTYDWYCYTKQTCVNNH